MRETGAGAHGRRVLFYRDPMHPSYTDAKPGRAPDCGMDLQPVYADDPLPARGPSAAPVDAIRLSRQQREIIGVSVSRVERSPVTDSVRTIGRVEIEENRLFTIRAGGAGTVTRIAPGAETGSHVRSGQPLVVAYSRDYTAAQRTFLYALRASENPPPSVPGQPQDPGALSLREATRDLQSIGFDNTQIERLSSSRQVGLDVTITSPADGTVIARNVSPGQRFEHDAELFRIADLTHVWVSADVAAGDETNIRAGTRAEVTVPGRSATVLHGTVAETLPQYDNIARTARLRVRVDNPHLLLRPGMIVDIMFAIVLPDVTTIPADAVADNGTSQLVFVEVGEDAFEARPIRTGRRFGGRVEILDGLAPGESIVVKGPFLLESEHRLRRMTAGLHD
jgi:multidrug efflux pump subunit AcrA (membrane-fusion protein)